MGKQLTQHFHESEFYCKGGGCKYVFTSMKTIILLEMLHACILHYIPGITKVRIKITSGIRCPQHNIDSGGFLHSRHMVSNGGDAADIKCYVQLFDTNKWIKVDPTIIYNFLHFNNHHTSLFLY